MDRADIEKNIKVEGRYYRLGWKVVYQTDKLDIQEIVERSEDIPDAIESVIKKVALEYTTFRNYEQTIKPLFSRVRYPSRYDNPCTDGVTMSIPEEHLKESLIELRPRIEMFYKNYDELLEK